MSKRILVIGGNGFIGRQLVSWLVDAGQCVNVFDLRLPEASQLPDDDRIRYIEGNFLNTQDVEIGLWDVDTVIHCVSTTVPASSVGNVSVEIETNVLGTTRLLDLMIKHGVRRICYPSSGGTVYGPSSRPHAETEDPQPTCPYGLGKVLIETLLRFYAHHHGIQYQIWRLANPYGDVSKSHMAQGVVDAFLQHLLHGRPVPVWGEGLASRDYILIDDAVSAMGALLESEAWGEVVNIGTGVGTSISEVIDALRATLCVDVMVDRRPGYTGPSVSVLNVDKLKRLTGWTPEYDLRSGIRLAWKRLGGKGCDDESASFSNGGEHGRP
jgi:UDP-glucose 4-epimerase